MGNKRDRWIGREKSREFPLKPQSVVLHEAETSMIQFTFKRISKTAFSF